MMKNKLYTIMILLCATYCYAMDITKKPTLYLGLCTEFWDLDKPTPPMQEYNFFRHYIAQSKGPILEPMCGTGRYYIAYLEEGFTLEGFDCSSFMLDALRKKCSKKNLSVCVWEQYIELVPETKQYDLIFIPDTSFCIFLEREHIKRCLEKFYALLLPGGTFVLDLQTEYSRPRNIGIWNGTAYLKDDGNTLIESVLYLPIKNSIISFILRYELMSKTELLKTEMEHYRIKLYQPGEMDELLQEVGFSQIKKIKAHHHGRLPSLHDDIVVYECIK